MTQGTLNAAIAVGASCCLLVACSSSDGGSGSNQVSGSRTALQTGRLTISQASAEANFSGSVDARFIQYNQPVTAIFSRTLDTCSVVVVDLNSLEEAGEEVLEESELTSESISAGESLVVSSPAGTLLTLQVDPEDETLRYLPLGELTLPSPLPSALTLDIPGDVFPMFANLAIPDVQPMTGFASSSGETITTNSVFTWDPGNNPEAFVHISFATTDEVAMLETNVFCDVVDDGEFGFPLETQAELGVDFAATVFVGGSRRGENTVRSGDAVLTIRNISFDFN